MINLHIYKWLFNICLYNIQSKECIKSFEWKEHKCSRILIINIKGVAK